MIIKKFSKTVHISIDQTNFKDYFKYDSMDSIKDLNNNKLFEYMAFSDIDINNIDACNVGCWYDFNVNGCEYTIILSYNDILKLLDGKTVVCDRIDDPALEKRKYRKLFHFMWIFEKLNNGYAGFNRITLKDGSKGYLYNLTKPLTHDNITLLKKYDNVILCTRQCEYAPEIKNDAIILID